MLASLEKEMLGGAEQYSTVSDEVLQASHHGSWFKRGLTFFALNPGPQSLRKVDQA